MTCSADLVEGCEAWHLPACRTGREAVQHETVDAPVGVAREMVSGSAHHNLVPGATPRNKAFFKLRNDAGGHFFKFIAFHGLVDF